MLSRTRSCSNGCGMCCSTCSSQVCECSSVRTLWQAFGHCILQQLNTTRPRSTGLYSGCVAQCSLSGLYTINCSWVQPSSPKLSTSIKCRLRRLKCKHHHPWHFRSRDTDALLTGCALTIISVQTYARLRQRTAHEGSTSKWCGYWVQDDQLCRPTDNPRNGHVQRFQGAS